MPDFKNHLCFCPACPGSADHFGITLGVYTKGSDSQKAKKLKPGLNTNHIQQYNFTSN